MNKRYRIHLKGDTYSCTHVNVPTSKLPEVLRMIADDVERLSPYEDLEIEFSEERT